MKLATRRRGEESASSVKPANFPSPEVLNIYINIRYWMDQKTHAALCEAPIAGPAREENDYKDGEQLKTI